MPYALLEEAREYARLATAVYCVQPFRDPDAPDPPPGPRPCTACGRDTRASINRATADGDETVTSGPARASSGGVRFTRSDTFPGRRQSGGPLQGEGSGTDGIGVGPGDDGHGDVAAKEPVRTDGDSTGERTGCCGGCAVAADPRTRLASGSDSVQLWFAMFEMIACEPFPSPLSVLPCQATLCAWCKVSLYAETDPAQCLRPVRQPPGADAELARVSRCAQRGKAPSEDAVRKSIAEIGHLDPGDVIYMSPSNEVLAHLPYMVALHRRGPLAMHHPAARRAAAALMSTWAPCAFTGRPPDVCTLCSRAHPITVVLTKSVAPAKWVRSSPCSCHW